MKKIISAVAVIALAVMVFISTKSVNPSSDTDMADLVSLNSANAECVPLSGSPFEQGGKCFGIPQWGDCVWIGSDYRECFAGY